MWKVNIIQTPTLLLNNSYKLSIFHFCLSVVRTLTVDSQPAARFRLKIGGIENTLRWIAVETRLGAQTRSTAVPIGADQFVIVAAIIVPIFPTLRRVTDRKFATRSTVFGKFQTKGKGRERWNVRGGWNAWYNVRCGYVSLGRPLVEGTTQVDRLVESNVFDPDRSY